MKRLILSFCLLSLVAHAADDPRGIKAVYSENRTALVIGNSAYPSDPLRNPVNDAREIARLLEQRKFDVMLVSNANKRQMEVAIEEFGRKLAHGGVGMFYYAGHAMQAGGVNYLIPVDAALRKESDLKYRAVDAGTVLGEMDNNRNRLNVVVLDACRDNPFARSFRSAGKGLARMDAPRGTLIAYATSPGRTAADGEGDHGVYTSELTRQLMVPGKELLDMFRDTAAGVERATGDQQVPWMHSSVTGKFYFTPIDVLDDNLALTAEELARYKKLLAEQAAADAQMKKLEAEKNASMAQMEREIEALRRKLNQPGMSGSTLDQLAALADRREQYAKDLAAAKAKAEQERQARAAEMARLRAQEQANRKRKFEVDYAKYRKIADSRYMRDTEKSQAWTLICSNWGVTGAADVPGVLVWNDDSGIVSAQAPGPAPGQDLVVDLGGGVEMEMVWIEPGAFTMGSPTSEEKRDSDETQHRVTLSKGFWMGKYEVTQEQWQQVMGSNPSHFKNAGNRAPVESVSWNDCQDFLARLNRKGTEGTFRLPTEAEWEYACRAGTTTPFHYGNDLDASMANFDGNYPYGRAQKGEYRQTIVRVGSFKPNAFGLYDMHGNVWEWCRDWYGEYPSGSVTDPTGPSSGSSRVLRGGSWYDVARDCRSANRYRNDPTNRNNNVGLRVVLCR